MRRADCPNCGILVESVPWAEGKLHVTTTYAWFLARWAKRMSWKEVAQAFHTTWDHVFHSVELAVRWGLSNRDLENINAIGVDEVQWMRGHKYLTVVYQINEGCKRLLWIGRDRTEKSFKAFFQFIGKVRSAAIEYVCSDMWQPYLNVIAQKAAGAVHVLDRFHVASMMNKAIDLVRATEAKEMKQQGYEPVLKHSRWCLLKRPENLTGTQEIKLAELLKYNLKSVRSYLLKEEFHFFWEYISIAWAEKFFDRWCKKVMRSRIEPMKKIVQSLRSHKRPILNWFKARDVIALGAVEGLNNKLKLVTRKAYGFRTFKAIRIALYHAMGALPEPESTHEFY
jgi:transposase